MPQEPNEPQAKSQTPKSSAEPSMPAPGKDNSQSCQPEQPTSPQYQAPNYQASGYQNTSYQTPGYQNAGYQAAPNYQSAANYQQPAPNTPASNYQAASGYQTASDYQAAPGVSGASTSGYQAAPGYQATPGAPSAPFQAYSQGAGQAQSGFAAAKPKSHAWIVGIVIVVALCLVTMFGMWSCSNVFSSAGASVSNDADLLTSDTVAIINIDGTIQYDGTTSSPEGLKEQLDVAANNSHIKAVVLRVNSGGGTATAGEEMTEYIRDFKESTGKPVVVSSAATNASAAYEISSQADYIYVGKTTAIGAIGTAMQFMDYSGLMEMLGITTEDITSSESKDSTYGTRALTDEERAYYQAQIDQINQTFIDNVAQGRNMSVDEVRTLATGLTFTGLDAVENGLADEVGTQEDAVAKAASLAGCSTTATVVLDSSSSDDLDLLLDLMSKTNTQTTEELAHALKGLEANGSFH